MDLKFLERGEKIIMKKKAGLKLKKGPKLTPSDNSHCSTEAIITPSTNARESRQCYESGLVSPTDDDKMRLLNFHLGNQHYNSQKTIVIQKRQDMHPVEQIKHIITENEKLRLKINQKQQIIDNLTSSKRPRPRLDVQELIISQRNSRSLLQPHDKQVHEEYGDKASISQNYKRSIINYKLPQIDSKQSSPTRDECIFTFANNFFSKEQIQPSPKRINMMQAFPQFHLQRKFFT